MSKKNLEIIAKALPAFFKNAIDYLKTNFDKNGEKILENTGGTAGVLISLFAQPLIDKYFKNVSEKKLEDFGFRTYLKASFVQANESLEEIKENLDNELSSNSVFSVLQNSIDEQILDFKKEDVLVIYQPLYHPAIVFVRQSYQRVLKQLNTSANDIKTFTRHFNENIEATVFKEFGDDYSSHIKETDKFRLKDNETNYLWDVSQLGKIGFKETENLKYEPTFAKWKKVSDLRKKDEDSSQIEDDPEKDLRPIENLIEEYFSRQTNNLESVLFIVADFGKGKSVFMRHYASELARKYIQTADGYFPIYFNLRDFKNYSTEPRLGVLSDYLESKYSIKIDDDYFKSKKYFFLVDSLDESGELNKRAIDNVIASIKNIQGIDKTKYKNNRIIITSRPFDEGLIYHLNEHNAFTIKNNEGRDIPLFIDIYGFTKKQFNEWLNYTLKTLPDIKSFDLRGFAKRITQSILEDLSIDIYVELLNNDTLSASELRRPIFAYMIFQLIINDVDFLAVGKLGVYLPFLNLLTKEAKHIHDINYKVNLKEEFEFRNILQATAALWMHERQKGRQGMLSKADICRVLEGTTTGETDNEILQRLKGQGLTEIQFLSHSYFGESDNILHFQHQSFAEILLAEYYLKIFIKYALDENSETAEARVKLVLGEPTEQTVLFLTEMLKLLRDTVGDITSEIIEKRKLLFPLMASLATQKNNRLFCNDIFYAWYKLCDFEDNQTVYPTKSLENWCIDKNKLDKIIALAADILNSKTSYLPTQANPKTTLFNNEVLEFQVQEIGKLPFNIDRWLALLVGNVLFNDLENKKLFNWTYTISYYNLFDMLKSWNFAFNASAPSWGKDLFIGINMESNSNTIDLSCYNFDGINFSYSLLKDFTCWNTNWSRCELHHCSFIKVSFVTSIFYQASIQDIVEIDEQCRFGNCEATPSGIKILDAFKVIKGRKTFPNQFSISRSSKLPLPIIGETDLDDNFDIFSTLSGFFVYGLKKSFFKIFHIKKWFTYESDNVKAEFFRRLYELKQFEKNK